MDKMFPFYFLKKEITIFYFVEIHSMNVNVIYVYAFVSIFVYMNLYT